MVVEFKREDITILGNTDENMTRKLHAKVQYTIQFIGYFKMIISIILLAVSERFILYCMFHTCLSHSTIPLQIEHL